MAHVVSETMNCNSCHPGHCGRSDAVMLFGCAYGRLLPLPLQRNSVRGRGGATARGDGTPGLNSGGAGRERIRSSHLGRGAITSALIDALHNGDRNRDGLIEVSELAEFVESTYPMATS
jgi:hypothetical protein